MCRPIVLLLAVAGLLLPAVAVADDPDPIQAGYQLFYRGDLRGAYQHFRRLADSDPQNLAAAYGVLSALYQRDLTEEALEEEFERRADALIERADRRHDRNQEDLEALFYLAQAYGLRAGYRLTHDKGLWGAVRDAVKAKKLSQTYLERDPERADAYIALGLYNYYAELAPSFLKVLRILLFIPSGDRQRGLQQLEHAAQHGELWAPQAKLELIQIYGWLEGRMDEALQLAEELHRDYPDSPELSFRLAALYQSPMLEAYDRAAAQYELILQRAEAGHPHYDQPARYQALLGLAGVRARQWRLQEAIALLDPVIDRGVNEPAWALPRSLLARANFRALLNDPNAEDDLRRILAERKWKERWHDPAKKQLKWIRQRRESGEAARYAELIPGNRLVAEGRWELAEKFYLQAQSREPDDWQVRYRLARLEFQRQRFDQAAARFREIVDRGRHLPKWLEARSLLHLARIHDLGGQREQALKLYKKVADDFDRESPLGLAARLGLLTPYKRILLAAR